MAWHKITFSEKEIKSKNHEALINKFTKLFEYYKGRAPGMALFRTKDNSVFYLNNVASTFGDEIIKEFNAIQTTPGKNLQLVEGDKSPLSFTQ